MGCGLQTLFNIIDITNSLSEPHFKATRWVIGELLKVNTANWQAFPLKYKVFDKYNTSTTKKGLWTAVFGSTRLITIFFYRIKEKKQRKNNSGKTQERESLSSKWLKVKIQFVSSRYGPLSYKLWDLMVEPVLQISSLSFREYSLFSLLSYHGYSFLP